MDLRTTLYPLGFLATLLFGARFIVQWITSEAKGKSVVPPSFWYISLAGNIALGLHTFIQIQYPFCLLQSLNAVLAWRNLNLQSAQKAPLKRVFWILFLTALFVTLAFIVQSLLSFGYIDWIRTPHTPWDSGAPITLSLSWHLFGFLGALIFALRFWLQWWSAEKKGESFLGMSFWWMSLSGASMALIYFCHMRDFVNIAGYGLGIIPYARNIILLYRHS